MDCIIERRPFFPRFLFVIAARCVAIPLVCIEFSVSVNIHEGAECRILSEDVGHSGKRKSHPDEAAFLKLFNYKSYSSFSGAVAGFVFDSVPSVRPALGLQQSVLVSAAGEQWSLPSQATSPSQPAAVQDTSCPYFP